MYLNLFTRFADFQLITRIRQKTHEVAGYDIMLLRLGGVGSSAPHVYTNVYNYHNIVTFPY